ncbi:Flagellar hook-length control protein FliK [Crocosphaera watsonii WH 0401]|uniref:Flagellar hook-length control protein FliK n=1 Tax=Crocosphaera watsonii WH 0401 TaxID=555881 RepID=T2JHC0_CROWT|nr:Flagellar hook-length control protein FliK [Crocosphaera watsonii WH 0401]
MYDLTPFLSAGDSQIVIDTENPSNNDNIFFAGINITAVAGVNEQPPTVPEPTSIIGLLTFGLFGLSQAVRKESK